MKLISANFSVFSVSYFFKILMCILPLKGRKVRSLSKYLTHFFAFSVAHVRSNTTTAPRSSLRRPCPTTSPGWCSSGRPRPIRRPSRGSWGSRLSSTSSSYGWPFLLVSAKVNCPKNHVSLKSFSQKRSPFFPRYRWSFKASGKRSNCCNKMYFFLPGSLALVTYCVCFL